MSPIKQSYKRITKKYTALRISGNNLLSAAEIAYAEQFKEGALDKEPIIARLKELFKKLGILLKEVTAMGDELITSGVLTFQSWSDLMVELTEYKVTIGMSLNTLNRRPTNSMVFTDRGGMNLFRFDFV